MLLQNNVEPLFNRHKYFCLKSPKVILHYNQFEIVLAKILDRSKLIQALNQNILVGSPERIEFGQKLVVGSLFKDSGVDVQEREHLLSYLLHFVFNQRQFSLLVLD